MQDRFKFRSYGRPNSIIEGMQNVYTFEEKENDYINVKVDKGWVAFVQKEDLKIMQCTGLKDKNGKLIYESDIVKLSSGAIGFIVFECQAYAIRFSKKDKYRRVGLGAYQSKELEIIGNIYENPELMKGGENNE